MGGDIARIAPRLRGFFTMISGAEFLAAIPGEHLRSA
jgi:hypothetical protein